MKFIERYRGALVLLVLVLAVVLRLAGGESALFGQIFRLPDADTQLMYAAGNFLYSAGSSGLHPKPADPLVSSPHGGDSAGNWNVPGVSRPADPSVPPTDTPRPTDPLQPTDPPPPPATSRPTDPSVTDPVDPPPPTLPDFVKADLEYVFVEKGVGCNYSPNLQKLLEGKLDLDLTGEAPTVLIIHSHATECYIDGPQDYMYMGSWMPYRCLNTDYNMVSVGDALAKLLEQAGISVIHDRTLHDKYAYDIAYEKSREAVQEYLQQYPSIQLVLDLHRDTLQNADGSQWASGVTVDGKTVAQLMLVMGTDLQAPHPNWQKNLALALKLQVLLEKQVPDLTRAVILRTSRYNQDLSNGALLIEFGTAGNTHAEVMRSVPYLARAIIELMHGSN